MSAMDYLQDERQREAVAFEVSQRIFELIRNNPKSNLRVIAEMLGATKFLSTIDGGRNKAPVLHFDVKGFVGELKSQHNLNATLLMPEIIEKTTNTILPPDPGEIETGSGAGIEAKEIIPRSRYLVELLSEMNIPYQVHSGTNMPNMMRALSYQAFVLPTLNKVILVNNEEGNATFIVHNISPENLKIVTELTKDQLKQQDNVDVIIFNKPVNEWKQDIASAIMRESAQPSFNKKIIRSVDSIGDNKEKIKRTPESALKELETAFELWHTKEGSNKEANFRLEWLKKNGFWNLYIWSIDPSGTSISDLVLMSNNDELKARFKRQEKTERTAESALKELEAAFNIWLSNEGENPEAKFREWWLKNNGYMNLCMWAKRSRGVPLSELVNISKNELLRSRFEKQDHVWRTRESALTELESAFMFWQETEGKNPKAKFNIAWLLDNGYKNLYDWSIRIGGTAISELVEKIKNEELKRRFEKLSNK